MDPADFAQLRSPLGTELLARVAAAGPLDDRSALRLGSELRRTHAPALVAAAITVTRLRDRAREKFGAAAPGLWFTPAGLEQATHRLVAEHRAHRLVAALGPGTTVLDLCCGIGADLAALADAGLCATGVELDPVTAAMAAANTAGRAQVECTDATTRPLDSTAVFVDPARRGARGRVFDPYAYTPPWPFLTALLGADRPAAAKVAPGIDHAMLPAGVETEWVSLDGAVKEAALYADVLGSGVRRRATLLPAGHSIAAAGPAQADEAPPVGAVGRWLHEPDGAVIRAHLVGAVATAVDGRLLDPTIAYVTCDSPATTPFARSYEITDVLPFSVKALRAELRRRKVGRLTVKKRGSGVKPERLRHDLLGSGHGDGEATLVVTRAGGRPIALLVVPVQRPEASVL